jgi:tight adherence protein C
MDLVFYMAVTLTIFLVVALLLAPVILRPSLAARRMLEMVRSNRPDERNVGSKERLQEKILSTARFLRVRFGLVADEKVTQQLLSAGIRTNRGRNAYSASRVVGPVLGLACGSLIPSNTIFWALSLAAVCYLLPDMWLRTMVKK